jgi:hypothetical protein
MGRRVDPDIDDEETSIFEGDKRPKKHTERGHEQSMPVRGETAAQRQYRLEREKEEFRRRALELATPTAITPEAPVPEVVPKVGSDPIRVISMKTPAAPPHVNAAIPQPPPRAVKLRSISEVSGPAIQIPLGNLAPPRDPGEAVKRRARDYLIVALAVLIVGGLVMLGVVLLAR